MSNNPYLCEIPGTGERVGFAYGRCLPWSGTGSIPDFTSQTIPAWYNGTTYITNDPYSSSSSGFILWWVLHPLVGLSSSGGSSSSSGSSSGGSSDIDFPNRRKTIAVSISYSSIFNRLSGNIGNEPFFFEL